MVDYNWINDHARLKALLDSGIRVITKEMDGSVSSNLGYAVRFEIDQTYRFPSRKCYPNSERWDEIMSRVYCGNRQLLFIDPTPESTNS